MSTQVNGWSFRRGLFAAVVGIVAAFATPDLLLGQTTTGAVRGYVRDQTGAPLADAQISARNVDLGAVRNVTSNASGFYSLSGLRPGRYEITARRLGQSPRTQQIQVPIAQTITTDITLQSGAVQLQAVTTVAENIALKTSESGMNVSPEQIRDLPLFNRNFLELAKLAPGITPKNVNDERSFLSAGGQSPEAINVFVDGATYKNDVLQGGVVGQDASKGNPFPQGAVQEFRIITQNYKAEYQKASSAIITATTKTGSNQWEVDAFAFGVGKAYVAKDAYADSLGRPRSNYERLQAGGSIGGPIKRDKLFFFGTYELNFRDQPNLVIPGPNAPSAPAGLNPQQFAGSFTSAFREQLGFAKVTWLKSDKSTVDGSINIRHENDFRDFGGTRSFEAAEDMKVDVLTGTVNWRRAGNTWLNEAQVNAQNFVWNPEPKNPNVIGKNYIDIIRIGGRDSRQKFTQNRISLRNDVTRSPLQWAGDHVFKVGGSVDFLSYESIKHQFGNPLYEFRQSDNYAFPFQALFGFGDPQISTNNTQFGVYLQDDWDVTPKLTLNLGVRWDVETNMINNDYVTPGPLADSLRNVLGPQFFVDRPVPTGGTVQVRVIDQLGGIENYITSGSSDRPIYMGAIQPRFGASYDIRGDGSTILFAGAGIYYDRNYWNTLLDEQFRRQFKVLRMEFNTTGPTVACPRCVQWNNNYFDPAQLQALAASGQSGLPEVFLVKNDMKPPRSQQMSGGVRQRWGAQTVSLSYNAVRGFNGMNYIRASQGLAPNYAVAFIADDRVKTWYDAMQLQVERPMSGRARWGGALAYTLAKSEQQGQSTDLFWGFDNRYPTVADLPRKTTPGTQTHTIALNGVTRLPYQFVLSGILNLGSGIRETGTDATAGFGPYQQVFYVFEPPKESFLGMGHVFATQNLDLRLQRDLPTARGQNATLIVDLFNATGAENWGCHDRLIRPTGDPAAANWGRPGCAGLGRRLQVGLRYGYKGSGDDSRR